MKYICCCVGYVCYKGNSVFKGSTENDHFGGVLGSGLGTLVTRLKNEKISKLIRSSILYISKDRHKKTSRFIKTLIKYNTYSH